LRRRIAVRDKDRESNADKLWEVARLLLESAPAAIELLKAAEEDDSRGTRKQITAAKILLGNAIKLYGLTEIEHRISGLEEWKAERDQIHGDSDY